MRVRSDKTFMFPFLWRKDTRDALSPNVSACSHKIVFSCKVQYRSLDIASQHRPGEPWQTRQCECAQMIQNS